MLSNSQR